MTDNTALAVALQALANAVAALRPSVPTLRVLDPFASSDPFDLSSRSGSLAYEKISSPLEFNWNGDVSSFPLFIVSLRIHAREGKWDATGDKGIL